MCLELVLVGPAAASPFSHPPRCHGLLRLVPSLYVGDSSQLLRRAPAASCASSPGPNTGVAAARKRYGEAAAAEDSHLFFSPARSLQAVRRLGFKMRINRLALTGAGFRRFLTRQTLFLAVAICAVWFLGAELRRKPGQWSPLGTKPRPPPQRMPTHNVLPPLLDPVACYGPRGLLLNQSRDDALESRKPEGPSYQPWAGSFEAIGLDRTVMTADQRYGPYGFGEDRDDYRGQKVDWDKLDWGRLQNECFERNRHRFPSSAARFDDPRGASVSPRFDLRGRWFRKTSRPEVRQWNEFELSRRTAIVIRTWRGYDYRPEDKYYLRSLITEAALRSGGEYQVILLVDMKDYDGYSHNIWRSDKAYQKGLRDAGIPPEFQSLAVLWNERLLKSWYPLVGEYKTYFQVFQPMQLLALHYPEFDHFWQFEMDMRFLGDAGTYLNQLTATARAEPRKQALDRALVWHMAFDSEMGPATDSSSSDFAAFLARINATHQGGSSVWGPVPVAEIAPIGPTPPVPDPHDDPFHWGVGEEADVITTSYCMDALNPKDNGWPFRDWIGGLRSGLATPRVYCPPAVMRGSRALLLAVHQAQMEKGVRVPSEATLPSFALWHGLKLSFPQGPVFHREQREPDLVRVEKEQWWRGGPLQTAAGLWPDPSAMAPRGSQLTFWWEADWARHIFYEWMGRKLEGGDEEAPWVLEEKEGKLWAPGIVLHPVKHS